MLLSDELSEKTAKLLVDGKAILFAGAGLSLQARSPSDASARLPLWGDLSQLIARAFNEDLAAYGNNLFDLFDSIARKNGRAALEDEVRKAIPERDFEPGELHGLLTSLPWARIYTTNYDNLLARSLGEHHPISDEEDFEYLGRPLKDQPKLIHLHGTLRNIHTLTGEDYNQWAERHRRASLKVTVDGLEHCFLFMGYSNSDPHFRHGLIPLINDLKGRRGHPNFSWMWKPSQDQMKLLAERDGVSVHPIEQDDEWVGSVKKLVDAYSEVKSRSKKERRAISIENRDVFAQAGGGKARINGYKLFYYRDHASISRSKLAKMSNLGVRKLETLETVNRQVVLGPDCFKECSIVDIWKLEKALGIETSLEYGKSDDFLAYYIEYYKNNWKKRRKKSVTQQRGIFTGTTAAVVFDFGGTLTKPKFLESTWERIWGTVGYSLKEANELHHLFSAGKISHKKWCDLTCQKLRQRNFSESHFKSVYEDIQPNEGLNETFEALYAKGIRISIVSGSLRSIIQHVLGDSAKYVDDIQSNRFLFDRDGLLKEIRGHNYDFIGKSHFITKLSKELGCHPIDILFVGNSLNDEQAALSGARTLCVNPKHTHYHVPSMWNDSIREMSDLREILDYV
ncbi:HAD-IB family phosphatase [Thalassobius sp. Cn5-15]|uniref:HAD-IB family phosphatase n=1 Tax=Thalassobius sp. Cn5-15 TaxID=2917763 RepID=UPI001EF173C1|nr:HAD-IB family phosphatase [Thalassobius sp. Cn5-15]MCG7492945.1 HAD-IB family phosphatase [Thalassobius sp. Cn5-15]